MIRKEKEFPEVVGKRSQSMGVKEDIYIFCYVYSPSTPSSPLGTDEQRENTKKSPQQPGRPGNTTTCRIHLSLSIYFFY